LINEPAGVIGRQQRADRPLAFQVAADCALAAISCAAKIWRIKLNLPQSLISRLVMIFEDDGAARSAYARTAPMNLLIRFLRDETAATAIEYALIAVGIAVAIIGAVNGLGSAISAKYTAVKDGLDSVK
jgi:pilus assembly protein Flp/PilA